MYLHLGTLLFAGYVLLAGTWAAALAGFVSIALHEAAHGLAALLCGQPPQEIELTPMGALLRLEDEQRLPPLRRALILAAGPAMTLLLCILSLRLTAAGWLTASIGRVLFLSNAAILMMNLLPALPLDGGRLLALALGMLLRGETVARIMRTAGTVLGLSAVGGSVWLAWQYGGFNWSLAVAGCFLMYSAAMATTTQVMAELQRLMDRKSALEGRGYAPVHRLAVIADVPLHRAVRLLHPRQLTEFAVMERGTMRVLGMLTEAEAVSAWLDASQTLCGEALRR
ncbi:MAG: M50 family metallopeptidase [Clostridia bacterium]|nr:M50 family metallopeptidase [Clostridia bacterium]